MQDLTSCSFKDHENMRNQPRTTREDLVNDLKAAETPPLVTVASLDKQTELLTVFQ